MRSTFANYINNPNKFSILRGIIRPNVLALVQTDGSFRGNISRTAVLLNTSKNEKYELLNTYLDQKNSTESEWCSILNGIQYSISKDEGSIELENDNLGVINSIIKNKMPKHKYLEEYYYLISNEIKYLDYFSIRWIPRELNKADNIFRSR
jgi:ribonuclease HI